MRTASTAAAVFAVATTRTGALAAAALFASASCGGPEPPPAPRLPEARRVALIVLDATHAKHIGAYGGPEGLTPALDRLAARGVLFRRALSNHTWTLPSTATLLTGQLQEHHGVVTPKHRLPAAAVTLAELFSDAGWETGGFVQMAYASDAYGLGQGFDDYTYYGFESEHQHGETLLDFIEWLERPGDARRFAYLHLRRPHSPYLPEARYAESLEAGCPLADGRADERLARGDTLPPGTELDDDELAHLRHLYRGNLATIDAQLDVVLRRMAASGDTLVVLTSDHGEALGEHGDFGHGPLLWAENVDVPLVFRGPGLAPRVDDGPACTVDVFPTLVELCGLARPPAELTDGVSLAPRLLGEPAAPREPILLSGTHRPGETPLVGFVDGDLKYVLVTEGDSPADWGARVHDRLADAHERRDLAAERADFVERMEPLARRWLEEHRDAARENTSDEELSPELQRDLDNLGY